MKLVHEHTYGALWDYADKIRIGELTVKEAEKLCRTERDRKAKEARAAGFETFCGRMIGQKREYWSFGDPCGLTCTVYTLSIYTTEDDHLTKSVS